MIKQKQQDWVLNIINNPHVTTADLREAGLNADNTSLQSAEVYKQHEKITSNPLFMDENGVFDSNKFDKFYETALLTYNMLANDTFNDKILEEATQYGQDNIFVKPERRKKAYVEYEIKPNPDKVTEGLIRIGETELPTNSTEEIAQTQKVLVNPTEVYDSNGNPDWNKAIWHDAPNDSYFTDFFDTRVLASYDSDGTHIDQYTGELVNHKKGELKINELGTYFYENLDGRDVYDKQVLNKMNTLTTDGSFWNTYDFFDSDDIHQKSIGGTVLKNAVLVGSMFIPYVGPWVAGLSVASQLAGLSATFSKMLVGSDSPTLSAIEGWSKSVNRQTAKTQYAKEHTWCWENFIGLIGDVAGQLKEQRFLFEIAPAVIKGNKLLNWKGNIDEVKVNDLIKQKQDYFIKLNQTKLSDLKKLKQEVGIPLTSSELNQFALQNLSAGTTAKASVEQFIKDYQNIGSVISKGYMTMLTTADTYGEAINAGASDIEAALLTMGYAAAEAALLNSDIGQWILPELKHSKIRTDNILKTFASIPDKYKTTTGLTKEQKKKLSKHWFNKGKELFESNLNGSKGLMGQTIAGGLAEGVEEVSEELLSDFSKSAFNVVQWLKDSDVKLSTWDNMLDRYSMSLIGGFVGGGLTSAGTTFRQSKENITPESALQEIVYMLRDNKYDQLVRAVDKITFANPYLSSETSILEDGTEVQNVSKSNLNQDVKQILKDNLKLLNDILKSEGLKLSDNQFLDIQTLKDLKFANLQQSSIASSYLQDFNTLSLQIIEKQGEIRNLFANKQDHEKLSDTEQETYNKLNQELLELRTKKDQYLNGDFALDFIGKALFDLTPLISQHFTTVFFKDWVKKKLNKDIKDLSQEELTKERENFKVWNETERKDDINTLAQLYIDISRQAKELIELYAGNYNPEVRSIQEIIKQKQLLNNITTENFEEDLSKNIGSDIYTVLFPLISPEFRNQLYDLSSNNQEKEAFELLMQEISGHAYKYFEDFINYGIYNPEIRSMVDKTLDTVDSWLNNITIPVVWFDNHITEDMLVDDFIRLEEAEFNLDYGTINDLIKLKQLFPEINTLGDVSKIKNKIQFRKNNLKLTRKGIKNASYTNVTTFIQEFIKNNTDFNIDFIKLVNTINEILNQNPLNEIDLGNYLDDINTVIGVLNNLKAVIKGAYTDESIAIDNLFGFNLTLNELAHKHNKPWEDLPVISSSKASIILQDIELIEDKLQQARKLHELNTNKKLNVHDKIAVNKALLIYNKLKKFIVNIDDSWAKKELLQKALEEATVLQSIDNKLILTEEQKIKLEQELITIDDAVYELLNQQDKDLKDIFINFDFYDFSNQIISQDTKELSTRNFLSYLASRASIKKSIFNNTFRQVIDPNQPIAPVSIQEEVVFSKVAEILNNSKSTEIYKAFNRACLEDFSNQQDKESILNRIELNEAEKQQVLTKGLQSIDLLPRLYNIHLTEGDPGSGKSTAINYYVKKIIDVINPNFFKNSWVAHGDSDRAEKQANELGIKTNVLLGKNELMSKIYSQYKTKRDIDREGNIVYNKEEWIYKDGEWRYNGISDATSDIPNIILIDEVSHYDQADLQLLQDFAEKHNIVILVSGDFNQSSITAVNPSYNLSITPVRTIFKTSPFIGISMRTSNNQMDKSINSFKVWSGKKNPTGFNTYFYEVPGELKGIKNVKNLQELEETINNIKTNEKINLIYYDINSPFVKTLTSKYPDKFELKFGNSAQGLEGQYYVVDFTGTQSLQADKDFYTAITRAQNGVITIGVESALMTTITSLQDTISIETKSPEIGYKNYAKTRKKILDASNTTQELLEFSKKIITKPTITKPIEILKQDQEEITLSNEIENGFEPINESPTPKPFDDNLFTYMLYSFNSFELGVNYDDNGNISFFDDFYRYEDRIDSVIGLMKIFEPDWKNPNKDINFYKNKIKTLRRIFFNVKSGDDLKIALSRVLGQELNHLEFGLISNPYIPLNKDGEPIRNWGFRYTGSQESKVLDKHVEEFSEFNLKEGKQSINRKAINAVIQLKDGKWLTIPLFNLGNILTLGNDSSKNNIAARINQIRTNSTNKYEAIKTISKDSELPVYIRNLAKLYLFDYAGYFKIEDTSWTPAGNLQNWGLQITTQADSNGNNKYVGEEHSIQELIDLGQYNVSKQIYSCQKPFYDNQGNEYYIGNIGHPFIYITNNGKFVTDQDMEEQYKYQLLNPTEPKYVLRVYIQTPKVSIETYLRNLHDIFNKKESLKLGSHVTSFHIWKALLEQDPNLENEFYKNLTSETKNKVIQYINNAQSDLISYVKSIDEGRSIQQQLNYALIQLTQSLDGNLLEAQLSQLVQLIENASIKEIYYSPKFRDSKPGNSITSVIYSDQDNEGNSSYTINGLSFTYIGKIDSNLFSTKNLGQIIESFVEKIDEKTSLDTSRFLEMISSSQFTINTADRVITLTKLSDNNYILPNGVVLSESEKNLLYRDKFDQYINQKVDSDLFDKDEIYKEFLDKILANQLDGITLIDNILKSTAKRLNVENTKTFVYYNQGKYIVSNLDQEVSIYEVPIYEGIPVTLKVSESLQIEIKEDGPLIKYPTNTESQVEKIDENTMITDFYNDSIFEGKTFKDLKNDDVLAVDLLNIFEEQNPDLEKALKNYLDEEQSCLIINKV